MVEVHGIRGGCQTGSPATAVASCGNFIRITNYLGGGCNTLSMDADNHFGFVVDTDVSASVPAKESVIGGPLTIPCVAESVRDMAGNGLAVYDTVAFKSGCRLKVGIIKEITVGAYSVLITPLDVLTGSRNIWTKRGSNTRKQSSEIVKMQLPTTSKIIT